MTEPALSHKDDKDNRFYTNPVTGRTVPSVTTILKAVPKPFLINWAARLAAEYALSQPPMAEGVVEEATVQHLRHRDAAGEFGTRVHENIEARLKQLPPPHQGDRELLFLSHYAAWEEQYQAFCVFSEATVWSDEYGYAGTADWIGDVDGVTTLLDVKNSKSVSNSYGLQLAALAEADCILTADGQRLELPKIQRIAVLHLRDQGYRYLVRDDWSDLRGPFLAAKAMWEFDLRWGGWRSLFREVK